MSSVFLALLVLLALLACLPVAAADNERIQRLDREFQAAVAQLRLGPVRPRPPRSWKSCCPKLPESFEIHELLGLIYSAQSQDAKASPHLEKAVRLKPDSAAARTNLAANLVTPGEAWTGRRANSRRRSSWNHGTLTPTTTWVSSMSGPAKSPRLLLFSNKPSGSILPPTTTATTCLWLTSLTGQAQRWPPTGPGSAETKEHRGTAQPAGRDRGKRREIRRRGK